MILLAGASKPYYLGIIQRHASTKIRSNICASSYLQIQLAIKSGLCPEFVHVCLNFVLHLNGCWASREWARAAMGELSNPCFVQSLSMSKFCTMFVHVQDLSIVCPVFGNHLCSVVKIGSLSNICPSPMFVQTLSKVRNCLSS